MIQAIEPLHNLTEAKTKLTIPLLASFLSKSYKPADIARACNVSPSAVSQAISKGLDQLYPLIDSTDALTALKAKHIADLAQDRLIKHLPTANKKQLSTLNLISGVHIDKYRLLSDKSTQNVSIASLDSSLDDLNKREQELLTKLNKDDNDV